MEDQIPDVYVNVDKQTLIQLGVFTVCVSTATFIVLGATSALAKRKLRKLEEED